MSANNSQEFTRTLGTWQVLVAGVALVVAATTLVSDFAGYFQLGIGFAVALVLGFLANLLLGLSASDLSVAHPKAGAIYEYGKAVISGQKGRFLATFLGLTFFGALAFAVSGEMAAGAYGFQALLGIDISIEYYILLLAVLAVIPNIIGIKTAAWASAGLLILMLGIRWVFGLAGFLGVSATGGWEFANLIPQSGFPGLFGAAGILTAGLALGFWSFVGIEFACSLAEEVKSPSKSIPRGVIAGLVVILLTSLVMGIGVTGTQSLSVWQEASAGALGRGGEAPQLAVGQMMFGSFGYWLMALASVTATLGSLVVGFAAMPRLIYGLSRDGNFFGPLSKPMARLHPRYGTPVVATIFTAVLFTAPALVSSQVVTWLYSAAYVWIILYALFHVLALVNRRVNPNSNRAFRGRWFTVSASVGVVVTLSVLYFAFAGSHLEFGGRALVVLGAALVAAFISVRSTRAKEIKVTRETTATVTSSAA